MYWRWEMHKAMPWLQLSGCTRDSLTRAFVLWINSATAIHEIIELFELEESLKGHLVQLPCNEQGLTQLEQVA